MKKIIYLSLLFLFACSSGNNQEQGGGGESTSSSVKITSEISPVVGETGGTVTISFTSSNTWSASVSTASSSWCSIDSKSGKSGSNSIVATILPNDSYSERNASVIVYCGNARASVTITQKQNDAIIITSDKVEIDYKGGTTTITVKSNVEYQYAIISGESWIKEGTGSKALNESNIYLDIDENWEEEVRQGKVTITSGSIKDTVTIYQQASTKRIVLSQTEYNLKSAETEIKVELMSNCSYTVQLPEVDWIEETASKAVSAYTHYFKILENKTYDSRSATIKFIHDDDSTVDSVVVNQSQVDAIVLSKNEYEVESREDTLSFVVNTNVNFQTEIDVDWITELSLDSKALEEVPVCFKISKNSSGESRIGHITFSAGDISQKITVTQKPSTDLMKITFSHNGATISAPEILGNGISGNINWGDSKSETYSKSATHSYTDSNNKNVVINVYNAESVKFNSLKSISSIDFEITEDE